MELETKTFTNPGVWSYMNEISVAAYEPDGSRGYAFSREGWDMEVTFTRKPPPFEPGYYMRKTATYAHPTAIWLETMPQAGAELFWKAWKRVAVADVEGAN